MARYVQVEVEQRKPSQHSTPNTHTTHMSLPSTMKAALIQGKEVKVSDNVKLPELLPHELLVRARAVAGNPTDWKHIQSGVGPQGSILGCDIAGDIVALGSEVDASKFKVGDAVYAFIHGAAVLRPTNGAYAEYAAVDSKLAFLPKDGKLGTAPKDAKTLPAGRVSTVEDAASIPLTLLTAAMVLHNEFGVRMEWHPATPQHDHPILFWGGATSVGQPLIQLAKNYNAFSKILVVASKKHEAKLKAYGADEVFDYHDADVIDQITSRYPNIRHLVDCVSTKDTIQQVYQCAARDGSDAVVCNLTAMKIDAVNQELRRNNVSVTTTLVYAVFGKEVPYGSFKLDPNPVYRKRAIDFVQFITPKLNDGTIEHIPIKIYRNGLQSVADIVSDLQHGRNSGEKLVASLS